MEQWLAEHWLDFTTTLLGLLYIWFEYRLNVLVWVVGIIMPAMDIYLYWDHGLYGDAALAVYYLGAAIWGYVAWSIKVRRVRRGVIVEQPERHVTHMPPNFYLPSLLFFLLAWAATWYVLSHYTNSTVPVLDGFTNGLSFVGLWALSRKYVEQWLIWIVVDAVACYLYIIKGIPFKAGLYGLYILIAVAGYVKWHRLAAQAVLNNDADPAE